MSGKKIIQGLEQALSFAQGWNAATEAAAKIADAEMDLHEHIFAQVDKDPNTSDSVKEGMKDRIAARVRTAKFIAAGIRGLDKSAQAIEDDADAREVVGDRKPLAKE